MKAGQLGCEIISLGTMPDHAHLFVRANPTLAPNRIVGELKGSTSRMFQKEFRPQTTSDTLDEGLLRLDVWSCLFRDGQEANHGAEAPLILTFKVRHGKDLSVELLKTRRVAEFVLETKTHSSKD